MFLLQNFYSLFELRKECSLENNVNLDYLIAKHQIKHFGSKATFSTLQLCIFNF